MERQPFCVSICQPGKRQCDASMMSTFLEATSEVAFFSVSE